MSGIPDPSGGDGPNKGELEPSDVSRASDSGAEDSEEGGRDEGGGRPAGDETKTSSKGINPVQHSE